MHSTSLTHLFSPIQVGSLRLKNRIVLLPTALGYAQAGKPTKRLISYLTERAEGGAGVVCSPFNVHPSVEIFEDFLLLDASDDSRIPAFREFAKVIHDCGTPIVGQLITIFGWRKDKSSAYEFAYPSVSAIRNHTIPAHEMTLDEIRIFISQYGEAARRLRESGFDAIEVMGAVGATISRFMSPMGNRRQDQYGGSFENRMRLPLEIIESIKKSAGNDFTILWRYSGHEFMDGGYDNNEAILIGQCLEKAGVSWLNIQVGWHDSSIPLTTKEVPQGHWTYLAENIKRNVNIPVVTAYRITDPIMADQIIAEGKADLVGMARALFADPELPNKAKNGKFDEINRCICCCRCIDQVVSSNQPLEICSVNPRTGAELELQISPTTKSKRILIIGSGPAGMEAARVCATRGHKVTLWEKADRPGGWLNIAQTPPNKGELGYLMPYLNGQLVKLGVEIKLRQEATAQSIIDENADIVILATGSAPLLPAIPGIDDPKVIMAVDLLSSGKAIGRKALIIGGGLIGCETALYLAGKEAKVTLIEMLEKAGMDIGPSERHIILRSLRDAGVEIYAQTRALKIQANGVLADHVGVEGFYECDNVVIAAGMTSANSLKKQLNGKISELYSIGDCVRPQKIGEAIKDGFRLGSRL